jgi:hypothetical protein
VYVFEGPVDGADDYYYLMRRPGGSAMLSCVGSIAGHGYEQTDAAIDAAQQKEREDG